MSTIASHCPHYGHFFHEHDVRLGGLFIPDLQSWPECVFNRIRS